MSQSGAPVTATDPDMLANILYAQLRRLVDALETDDDQDLQHEIIEAKVLLDEF
jgi:hypothetical protein